eukprot:scaffold4002_cov123-Isochrysis_galbana.AAC.3
MRSDPPDSPNPLSPPPPSTPAHVAATSLGVGGVWTVCTTSVLTIGWVERGESTLALVARVGFLISPSGPPPSLVSRGGQARCHPRLGLPFSRPLEQDGAEYGDLVTSRPCEGATKSRCESWKVAPKLRARRQRSPIVSTHLAGHRGCQNRGLTVPPHTFSPAIARTARQCRHTLGVRSLMCAATRYAELSPGTGVEKGGEPPYNSYSHTSGLCPRASPQYTRTGDLTCLSEGAPPTHTEASPLFQLPAHRDAPTWPHKHRARRRTRPGQAPRRTYKRGGTVQRASVHTYRARACAITGKPIHAARGPIGSPTPDPTQLRGGAKMPYGAYGPKTPLLTRGQSMASCNRSSIELCQCAMPQAGPQQLVLVFAQPEVFALEMAAWYLISASPSIEQHCPEHTLAGHLVVRPSQVVVRLYAELVEASCAAAAAAAAAPPAQSVACAATHAGVGASECGRWSMPMRAGMAGCHGPPAVSPA